jgi:hypothetical protein
MARYHGVDGQTFRKFLLDAGELRLGYTNESSRGTALCATRGGSVFAIPTEYREMAVDGAKGPVEGGRRITKVTAYMEINVLEWYPDLIQMCLPGSTTDDWPDAGGVSHREIKRALQIAAADYQDSISLIAEVSGSGDPFVGTIYNALADGDFELGFSDNEETVSKIKFTAHFAADDLDTEPWAIYFPTDILTTAVS